MHLLHWRAALAASKGIATPADSAWLELCNVGFHWNYGVRQRSVSFSNIILLGSTKYCKTLRCRLLEFCWLHLPTALRHRIWTLKIPTRVNICKYLCQSGSNSLMLNSWIVSACSWAAAGDRVSTSKLDSGEPKELSGFVGKPLTAPTVYNFHFSVQISSS